MIFELRTAQPSSSYGPGQVDLHIEICISMVFISTGSIVAGQHCLISSSCK